MKNTKTNLMMELINRLEGNEEWGAMLPLPKKRPMEHIKYCGWFKLEGNTTMGFIYYKQGKVMDGDGENVVWKGNLFLKVEYDKNKPYAYRLLKERA